MMTEEARRAEALQEYYTINDMIDRFDQRAIAIKSWSVTITGALFATSVVKEAPLLFLLPAGCAFLFWYIEGMWKDFQRPLIGREKSLQRVLNGDLMDRCECVPPRHFDFQSSKLSGLQYKYNGPQINTAIHAHIGRTHPTELCKNPRCLNKVQVQIDEKKKISPVERFRIRSRFSRLFPRTLRYINVMTLYLVMIFVSLLGYFILASRSFG